MKKNLMSLAVAASVAGTATTAQAAMYLDPEGTGQVLLYPYYNAVGTNETSVHIVNTTGEAKAVKVRILEYINSQEVLDFNLYLSKNDHFSFTIFQHPDGDNAALVTRDESCTVPRLGTATGLGGTLEGFTTDDGARIQPFLPFQYQAEYSGLDFDARSQVGHIEVIEMGVLTDEAGTATTAIKAASWATHDSTGVPANCDALVAAWNPITGAWGADTTQGAAANGDPTRAILAASGGLYGLSNVLDSGDAAGFGIDPAAIDEFWPTGGSKHTNPGSTSPSLGEGETNSIITAAGSAYTLAYSTTSGSGGWDAVSSLFMSDTVSNDVMINPVVNGMTDWVVTFPTKREYVNTTTASNPFGDAYARGSKTKPLTYKAANLACEPMTIAQWNREESITALTGQPIFSPAPPAVTGATYQMCLETNTLAMGAAGTPSVTNTVLAGTGTEYLPASNLSFKEGEVEGWMRMGFEATHQWLDAASSTLPGTNNDTPASNARLNGLPVMGFAAFKYANDTRSYGFVSSHKTTTAGSAIHS
jgi:hypothetical protein